MRWFARRQTAAAAPSPVTIDDLLGRAPVDLDTPQMQRFLAGKRVLVTGAGGSIGSEICRQTMRFCPDRLVMVERAENNLFEIDRELRQRWIGADLRPYVTDICDADRVGKVFDAEKPQVVFHCAAHKHVPMMERNPGEAVRNNVLGTKTVADATAAVDAAAFVMVSTDKAVNPTSVMGATKRVAELYVQSMNNKLQVAGCRLARRTIGNQQLTTNNSQTRFTAVRFGNVLGSSGSVVPIFQKQIASGGPVTVTHPDMKRYFMTIPEASQLVMQAGAIGQGGEIFVLNMGSPVKIVDLAREMIRRSGLVIGRDIELQFTGVRPGEKLYEELNCGDEQIVPTPHDKIHVWQLPPADPDQVQSMIEQLADCVYARRSQVMATLRGCVPEYTPTAGDDRVRPREEPAPIHLAA
jgi:FlaA1/EpsC-like NDP-sugar epimerase